LPRGFCPVFVLLVSQGCANENKQQAEQVREFSPAKESGLVFAAPEGWTQEQPVSRMRRAQYRLPKVEGDSEDAQVVVFYFGGSGGSVEANVDRWVGMFTKEDGSPATGQSKISKKQVNGLPVTLVDVSGTYNSQSMGPMGGGGATGGSGPKPHFRMLAAIAETSTGPWFIRLTGPKKTVDRWEKSFFAFVDSAKES
jgi:hypothetical protein